MSRRILWRSLGLTAALLSSTASAKGSNAKPEGKAPAADQSRFAAITEHGHYIAEAQEMRQRVQSEVPLLVRPLQEGETLHYVVFKEGETWYGLVGALSTDRATFEVQKAFSAPVGRLRYLQPIDPGTLPRDVAPLARAEETALDRVESEMFARFQQKPREPVVRPDGETFVVYVQPRVALTSSVVLGGDYRLTFERDGSTIIRQEDLHQAAFPLDLTKCPAKEGCVGSMHQHEDGSPPTETDVAMVMGNPKLAPHFVKSKIQQAEKNKDKPEAKVSFHIFVLSQEGTIERVAEITKDSAVHIEAKAVGLPAPAKVQTVELK